MISEEILGNGGLNLNCRIEVTKDEAVISYHEISRHKRLIKIAHFICQSN